MPTYTPLSYLDYTVSNPASLSFNYTKEILQASHIAVYQKPNGGEWAEITDFTATGSSGSVVVLLGGSNTLSANDTIRIARETPRTNATRLVDFQNGDGLSEDDLDTSALQNLYVAQEAYDSVFSRALNKGEDSVGGNNHFDADGLRIKNIGAPVAATDAARYMDITALSISSGNLPVVTAGQEASFLVVKDAAWTIRTNGQAGADLGIGLAGYRNIGTGSTEVIPILSDSDTRYFQKSEALQGIVTGLAQSNLGLGSAAPLNVGVSAGNIIQLDSNTRLPAVDGRNLNLALNAVNYGRLEAGAVIGFTTGSNTIPSTGEIRMFLSPIQSSYLNSSEITVNTTNRQFTVNGAGGIKARISVAVVNTGRSIPGDHAFVMKLNKNPDTVVETIWTSRPYYVPTGGIYGAGAVTVNYEYMGVNINPTTYEFKIAEAGASNGTSALIVHTGYAAIEYMS